MGPKSVNVAKHSKLAWLEKIDKSPYEGKHSAEVGERLFEYTQSLIDPKRGLGSKADRREQEEGPSDEAVEVFGDAHAKIIFETSRCVANSGMLYGCGWTDGIVAGMKCGVLPKELLLLCLCDHRMARSNTSETKVIVKDLDVWEIVSRALCLWKLKTKYPSLARCNNINSFKKRQNHCSKCILFLARAATCMKYLEWNFLKIADDTSLKTKIFACLDILEACVVVEKKKATKKRPIQKAKPVLHAEALGSEGNRCLHDNTNRTYPLHPPQLRETQIPLPDLGKKHPKSNACDLSRRLRCKDCRIAGIQFHSEPRKKRRTTSTVNHHNPGAESSANPESHIQSKKKETSFSHVLFATPKSDSVKITTPRKLDETLALATKLNLPTYVSDGITDPNVLNDSNFWNPVDEDELILSPLQIEMAWLMEESLYCQRSTKVDLNFAMMYASPGLQVELRKISCGVATNDEEILAQLLHNGLEAKRFAILRREIKRKLLKREVRTRMQGILPLLRMANHPLRRKKTQSKKMPSTKDKTGVTILV